MRVATKKADETRAKLLDAALEVMASRGYAEATMAEIARAAGVSKGLAYYHFSSKADLASELLAGVVGGIIDDFDDIATSASSGREALICIFEHFASMLADDAKLGSLFLSELWREGKVWTDEIKDVEERLVMVVAGQFERGRREGSVRREVDAEFAAVSCIGLVLTTAMSWYAKRTDGGGVAGAAGGTTVHEGDLDRDKNAYVTQVRDFIQHALDTGAV